MGGFGSQPTGQKVNPFFIGQKELLKMSETKRFYWLKLQEDFFEDDTIDFIESQENGEKYCLFYLKLCLKALKSEGKLIRYVGNMLIPYDEKGLAKLTRTDVDTVRCALALFDKIGLISRLDTGEIFISQLNEMVGTETDKAKLMRQKRAKEKLLGNNVTPMLPECYTEKEIDIEIEKNTEQEQEEIPPSYIPKTEYKKCNDALREIHKLILIHNENQTDKKKKIGIYKDFFNFSQNEGRNFIELFRRNIDSAEVVEALKNYLRIASSDSYISSFSISAFCKRVNDYIPDNFSIEKYIDAPKNEEDVQAITQKFADDNLYAEWFNYAVFHHNRKKWLQAGKPSGKEFEKWAEGCFNEDVKSGRADANGDYN